MDAQSLAVRKNSSRPIQLGFTLLEVMVALAVAAIGLGAISKSLTSTVDIADRLGQRTLATWVASNRLAELRIARQFVGAGSQTTDAELGGLRWRSEETYTLTPDPNISRVDIDVYAHRDDNVVVSLSGYIARYKPAETGQ